MQIQHIELVRELQILDTKKPLTKAAFLRLREGSHTQALPPFDGELQHTIDNRVLLRIKQL